MFGAILGIGGGLLIVPLLVIGFDLPLTAAIGTSLVCVVATSLTAAAVNVRAGRADIRLGIVLELTTVTGATLGGLSASLIPERLLAGAFAALMAYTAVSMVAGSRAGASMEVGEPPIDPTAPDGPMAPAYRSHRLPAALAGSVGAGVSSALLGIGGGVVKVPLLRLVMGAPLHIATATSNYVVGVTAAAGAYAYLLRGDVDAVVAGPMVLGVAAGAALGARVGPTCAPAGSRSSLPRSRPTWPSRWACGRRGSGREGRAVDAGRPSGRRRPVALGRGRAAGRCRHLDRGGRDRRPARDW